MLGPPALETSGHVLSPGSPTGPAHISSRAESGPGHSRTCTQLPTFTKEAQPECFQSLEAGMGPPESPCGWQVWAPREHGGRPQVRRASDQSPRGSHSAERVGVGAGTSAGISTSMAFTGEPSGDRGVGMLLASQGPGALS